MNLAQNLKNYFGKKESKAETGDTPVGVCPNCWGKQEWDGEYYTFMKNHKGHPKEDIYTNFIQDIAKKLEKQTITGDGYTCETCSAS